MNIEELRDFCLALPGVTEDVKWGDNLVFSVSDKMFLLADLNPPMRVSLKVPPEEFPVLISRQEIIQAPYFARNMWVCITDPLVLTHEEWESYVRQSYRLVAEKLPLKVKKELGLV